MNRILSFCCWMLFTCIKLEAQSVSLCYSVVGALGGYAEKSGKNYSYTVGETAVVTLQSPSGNLYLTQGFHQPEICLEVGVESPTFSENLHLKVFPNPVVEFLTVQFVSGVELKARIFNTAGLLVSEMQVLEPGYANRLDCGALPAGLYFLEICSQTSREHAIFRFVKI